MHPRQAERRRAAVLKMVEMLYNPKKTSMTHSRRQQLIFITLGDVFNKYHFKDRSDRLVMGPRDTIRLCSKDIVVKGDVVQQPDNPTWLQQQYMDEQQGRARTTSSSSNSVLRSSRVDNVDAYVKRKVSEVSDVLINNPFAEDRNGRNGAGTATGPPAAVRAPRTSGPASASPIKATSVLRDTAKEEAIMEVAAANTDSCIKVFQGRS